jgi:hypothetical protein
MTGNTGRSDAIQTVSAASAGVHEKPGLKARAAEEFRSFVVLFLYLWVLFGVFVLNQDIALREQHINFTMQGFALINALVFAKVMLVFEMFEPGRWLHGRPLIYPILYETLLLTVSFVIVHILEKIVEGLFHGKSVMESLPSVGGGGVAGLLSVSVIMFVALTPFFGLRHLSRVMGEGKLWAMMFGNSATAADRS